jgi:hypothetical protein
MCICTQQLRSWKIYRKSKQLSSISSVKSEGYFPMGLFLNWKLSDPLKVSDGTPHSYFGGPELKS